jgi:hypothetical protein
LQGYFICLNVGTEFNRDRCCFKKVNDDMVQLIKSCTKANRPAGNSNFIERLEKITGRSFSFNKIGRPKKEKSEIK